MLLVPMVSDKNVIDDKNAIDERACYGRVFNI